MGFLGKFLPAFLLFSSQKIVVFSIAPVVAENRVEGIGRLGKRGLNRSFYASVCFIEKARLVARVAMRSSGCYEYP